MSEPYRTVTIDDILPHLRATIYITGTFCTAWAWDLAFYGASHALAGENPLQDQLSFGNQRAPKHILDLLLQYLAVCGGAAVLSSHLASKDKPWSQAAVTAVEFFPAPVFAGKLMAYLGQFSRLGTVKRAVINLAATWFAASLAHVTPMFLSFDEDGLVTRLKLERFGDIVQTTLGFGLGIAWNVLLGQFAPEDRENLDLVHLFALAGYLAAVSLIAFRLAAVVKEPPETIWERQIALLSFAFYVVCAFTLVGFLNALMHPGWLGHLESLAILLVLSGAMSAFVAGVDFDAMSENVTEEEDRFGLHGPCKLILFLPCVWICCPWFPLIILLAGTETVGVKEHWFRLIAMVAGLASSIDASGMLTDATDALSASMGICDVKVCHYKWLFVLLQVVVAILVTVILIPSMAPFTPGTASNDEQTDGEPTAEREPLLRRMRSSIRKKFKRRRSRSGIEDVPSNATRTSDDEP